jgi:hypothetical protein
MGKRKKALVFIDSHSFSQLPDSLLGACVNYPEQIWSKSLNSNQQACLGACAQLGDLPKSYGLPCPQAKRRTMLYRSMGFTNTSVYQFAKIWVLGWVKMWWEGVDVVVQHQIHQVLVIIVRIIAKTTITNTIHLST